MPPPRGARAVLEEHRRAWKRKPLLRRVYGDYFRRISENLPPGGKVLEVGAGGGFFRAHRPATISSDLVPCPWLDCAADAMRLPVRGGALDGIVMVDVFHHLPRPLAFLREALRALRPGGRLVLLEPHVSLWSGPVYRLLHPEPLSTGVRPFEGGEDRPLFPSGEGGGSNLALASIVFLRDADALRARFPEIRVVRAECLSAILFPLSGGFREASPLPALLHPIVPLLERLDRGLERFGRRLGFRCLVVLERRAPA